ncbi:Rnf-Nqr domain containing protein [Harryflintia acetispora]|uniref:Electron transport complex protein RnfE n=1 Tax=Harryflintia acetispora TaxID=1849041 RepID=A0A9X8UI68_9FIRM|nr:Rnf-Nqr domain containing protein [Harryflintia acetispora]TCL42806.1 electron transport complex protein RnfE [Harryflintia acetispora]
MYLQRTRKHNRLVRRFSGLFFDNPVLSLGLALPLAISATNSLQGAFCVMIGMWATTLPVMLFSSLPPVRRFLPLWARFPVYVLLAVAILIPVELRLSPIYPVVLNSLGVYFPIIAVNTIMLYRCEHVGVRCGVLHTLIDGVLHLLGFSVVMALLACVRELFGYGSVWGIPVTGITFKLSGLLIPFSGCILLAFLAAGSRYIGRLWRVRNYRADLRDGQTPAEGEDEDLDDDLLI